MVSRQSLKLASGVRFAPSLPSFTGVMYGASAALYSASLQIRARTGFDSQRQYHRSIAKTGKHPALNRIMREFDSPSTDQSFGKVTPMAVYSAFNRYAAGSNPVLPTKVMAASSRWAGHRTFNPRTRFRLSLPLPSCVPFVQWIRTERYERSDTGSSPVRDTKLWIGGRMVRHLTVAQDNAGSNPVRSAKFSRRNLTSSTTDTEARRRLI